VLSGRAFVLASRRARPERDTGRLAGWSAGGLSDVAPL